MIHLGLTVQLSDHGLGGVTVQHDFLPCPHPRLAQRSGTGLDFVISPPEVAWPGCWGQVFIYLALLG